MNKTKILHVVLSLETGGLEKFVLDLTKHISDDFVNTVVCLDRRGDLSCLCSVEVLTLDRFSNNRFMLIKKILEIVHDLGIDLIHTHNEKAHFCGGLAGLFSGVPVIHTKHGLNVTYPKSRIRNYLLSLLTKRIVAVSNSAAEQCVNIEKISPNRVSVILNGVDTDHFIPIDNKNSIRLKYGIDEGVHVVGIVARLALIKNHRMLIDACFLLKNRNMKFKLLIVGDGPLMEQLQLYVRDACLSDYINFLGSCRNINELMNLFDVFVLPSVSEGLSLTLIEAMACCLPVVATDVGGNPDVVVDSKTGYLVPLGEHQMMADKICELLDDDALRSSFGKSARFRAEHKFSVHNVCREYEKLYMHYCS
jgi:glycosyltransferase involved in cell wall biosynthesis